MEIVSLGKGVIFCAVSSMLLGIGMAILVVIEKYSYTEPVIALFFYSLFLWCTLGVIFGFLGAVLIGIPVAVLLSMIKMFNPYAFLISGSMSGYFLGSMSWVTSEFNPYIQVTFIVYGAVGSLAFWYGARSNKSLNFTP